MSGFDIIQKLTLSKLPATSRDRILRDFSQELGWEPSDKLIPSSILDEIVNGHIIVDHGLDNSAVITFLIDPITFQKLDSEQINQLLTVSYNNLIDWHIIVDKNQATYINNRNILTNLQPYNLTQSDFAYLKAEMFDQIIGKSPNPNFPTLDNALIENISYWKRYLSGELNGLPKLTNFSVLFNAIFFVRAIEDHSYRMGEPKDQILIKNFIEIEHNRSIQAIISLSLDQLIKQKLGNEIIDLSELEVFNSLSEDLVYELFLSFYKNRRVPYSYDFAIMSKHALSRIYEHYVSILKIEDSPQLSFLPVIPLEKISKTTGSVYTPQFIAKFFAKYVREQVTPSVYKKLKILDPACGSGIFLRTFLEQVAFSSYEGASSAEIEQSLNNINGIDVDPNAVHATKLSLSLLYLVLMDGKLPNKLNVSEGDAINILTSKHDYKDYFDVVVANPPYISSENQDAPTRLKVLNFLGDLSHGKSDTYLPFLKLAIDCLKPGGYGLFVLPHSFLQNASSEKIRNYIAENAWIKCIVDLSAIQVFKDFGTYVILFIFQKKDKSIAISPSEVTATLVLCKDLVGNALQDCLSNIYSQNQFYSIYGVNQEKFTQKSWSVLPLPQERIHQKLTSFRKLNNYLQVNQGVISGADSVFIITNNMVPELELMVWPQLLRDRDMARYSLPKNSDFHIFYPYKDGKLLTEQELTVSFPKTWHYLNSKKAELLKRKSAKGNWWGLSWPRDQKLINSPKLISPHLILLPKFSFDDKGKYLVSHAPYLTAFDGSDNTFMKFFLGILNSSIGAWLISMRADKYSRGYARLEVKTLGDIYVPDPSSLPYGDLLYYLSLVDKKVKGDTNLKIDKEIDEITAKFYNLSPTDLSEGLGFFNA